MRLKIGSTLITLLITVNLSFAQDLNTFFSKSDLFFKTHVAHGKVDYESINFNQELLEELLALAENANVPQSNANAYQAFWINAYNLATIKGIIDNYPMKSPLDKSGFFDKITYNLGGKSVTLNHIENKLLRKQFNDPRVHFVLVCGAIGCPPLINEAYFPDTLESQLETQTTLAINGNFVIVNAKKKKVKASEILKWYKEDFVQNGTELDFINRYRTEKIPKDFKLYYFPYNWNLNTK